ncbi:hypothetical protein F5880DRAFT_772761 [Lentinula raphanica]|nr:hypothetical protein F5880DRAFT_772761 [Lentinula raphanica]
MGMGMLMFLSLHPQQFNWRRRERCPFFLRHQPSTTGTTSTKRKLEKHDKTSSSHSSASASKSGTLGVDPSTTKHFCSRKQAMLANEKRRRRRESHVVATRNALERRRRVINEKSGELATLIPSVMFGAERSVATHYSFLCSMCSRRTRNVVGASSRDDSDGRREKHLENERSKS